MELRGFYGVLLVVRALLFIIRYCSLGGGTHHPNPPVLALANLSWSFIGILPFRATRQVPGHIIVTPGSHYSLSMNALVSGDACNHKYAIVSIMWWDYVLAVLAPSGEVE